MNTDNLHELIDRYEAKIDKIYDSDHDELFKWRAMKTWRDEWVKPESTFSSFAERFTAARRNFSLFIDTARMHPSSGVIKLWEKEPETVEHLFRDVLFEDVGRNISATQDRMDIFLDEYEKLRQEYYPRNWSYKQDRHSASVFLAMNDPDFNYVFKSSEAHTMAKYIDFGLSIGAGAFFRLDNYYHLCDGIVSALKEHDSLLEKHFSRLTDKCYWDESLHLLAFDLMYCCNTYGYYRGLTAPLTGIVKKSSSIVKTEGELAKKECELLSRIEAIEQEIGELERNSGGYADISLLGVQVDSTQYGAGTVIEQAINKITVQFSDVQKKFILDNRHSARPRFEDDEQIVEIFTSYARAQNQIKKLRTELNTLQK